MIFRLNFPKWMPLKLQGTWEGRIKGIVNEVKTRSATDLVVEIKFIKPTVSKEKLIEQYSKRIGWYVLNYEEKQAMREKIKGWAERNYDTVKNQKLYYRLGIFNWSRLGFPHFHGQPCRILLRLGMAVDDEIIARLFAHEWGHYLQHKKGTLGRGRHVEPGAVKYANKRMEKVLPKLKGVK